MPRSVLEDDELDDEEDMILAHLGRLAAAADEDLDELLELELELELCLLCRLELILTALGRPLELSPLLLPPPRAPAADLLRVHLVAILSVDEELELLLELLLEVLLDLLDV